jgi:cytochrome P450
VVGKCILLTGLTRNEIVANAILFFMAGFETTASTLSFVFYELAMNPEIQDKVIKYANITFIESTCSCD